MQTLSHRFIAAVAQSPTPRYRLTARIGVAPSWLSLVMKPSRHFFSPTDRERLRDLASILGVPVEQIFEEE